MNSIQGILLLAMIMAFHSRLTAETRVLFCSDKEAVSNVFDLYTMRTDGADLRRLTTTPTVSEWAPALAPDGQRVVYVARSAQSPAGSLFLTDLAGAIPVQIPIPGQALAVQWEDNNTVVYLGMKSNQWGQPFFDIRRVHLDGSGDPATQTRLSDAFCGDPDFAPDGSFIVFTRATNSTWGIAPYIGNLVRIGVDGASESDLTAGLAAVSGRCAHPVVYSVGVLEIAPVHLQAIEFLEDGGVRLSWPGQTGVGYQVEYSSDLTTWHHDLPGSQMDTQQGETTLQFADISPRQLIRFYRVLAFGKS